jgi:hypothetical protein
MRSEFRSTAPVAIWVPFIETQFFGSLSAMSLILETASMRRAGSFPLFSAHGTSVLPELFKENGHLPARLEQMTPLGPGHRLLHTRPVSDFTTSTEPYVTLSHVRARADGAGQDPAAAADPKIIHPRHE